MQIVIDTSALIAVLTQEASRPHIISLTQGADLIAPGCLPWEVGNAFSAMFKRGRMSAEAAATALAGFRQIPLRLVGDDLEPAVALAEELGIYAYDAYYLQCARRYRSPLLSLDGGLLEAARRVQLQTLEVDQ